MRTTTDSRSTLKKAFHSFEQAAQHLEQRHGALRTRVEHLEQQLLDSNRRLEAVLDALEGGVAVVSHDGRLLRTNRAFDRLELVGEDGALRHPAIVRLVDSDAWQGGAARARLQSDAGPRDFSVTLVPVGDEDGTRVLTVQDVTEIRREEQEGGRRRRLEALGRMAAELAHEVRNPLGSIRLFACMLQDDLAGQTENVSMVEQILAATAGLEGTVSNLLAFASPSRGERRRLDLAQLASDVCSLFSAPCSVRGVRLEGPDPEEDRCPVDGDPEGLRQVLLNLLGNALAATDDGGRIRVSARSDEDRVLLEVEDDGRGIANEDLPRVFDPFFTRTEGGTGLGLSIVHHTIERHGGRINLDSQPGRGTRARVELPVPHTAHEESHA